MGVPFVKGHGTENDFILLPDADGSLVITDAQVRALCDRRSGLGADGVIVVRPTDHGFFMDYRNADGSIAEMCGNGARVFARYLVDRGWERSGLFCFATRGGVRTARLGDDGDVSIAMGPVVVGASSTAELHGRRFVGTGVDVGNPHLVCVVDDEEQLAALELTAAPNFDVAVFPHGVNIEFVVPLAPDRVRMRVFERGSGETRSCGTGTVAVAAAHLRRTQSTGHRVTVEVPGGTVVVTFADGQATLTGPAVIVASGTIEEKFWADHRDSPN